MNVQKRCSQLTRLGGSGSDHRSALDTIAPARSETRELVAAARVREGAGMASTCTWTLPAETVMRISDMLTPKKLSELIEEACVSNVSTVPDRRKVLESMGTTMPLAVVVVDLRW